MGTYRALDAASIIKTLQGLQRRVSERFPGAGLNGVCQELLDVAMTAQARAVQLARPNRLLRALVGAILVSGSVLLGALIWFLVTSTRASDDMFGILQGVDSAFNILILMGASLFFLVSLEDRRRRQLALRALHELRSIIHVIDMHQLTKDPSAETAAAAPTASSPQRTLTPEQTLRYLDYCSEMLSLASKVAALYAQSYPDPVVTESVSDIERTGTGLSQKIWQKINITHRNLDAQRGR